MTCISYRKVPNRYAFSSHITNREIRLEISIIRFQFCVAQTDICSSNTMILCYCFQLLAERRRDDCRHKCDNTKGCGLLSRQPRRLSKRNSDLKPVMRYSSLCGSHTKTNGRSGTKLRESIINRSRYVAYVRQRSYVK